MKIYALVAAGLGAFLFVSPVAFSQTENYSSETSRTTTAENPRGAVTNPHAVVNNSVPTGPGVGTNNPSQTGRANAVYVEHEIAKAKADGKNVSAAQSQYDMAMNALNNGMNKEAAQHFDAALLAVGVQPKEQGQNPGEPLPPHASAPGETHP